MKKKILIIDDSALMRRVLSDIMKKDHRFEVEDVASNGIEALRLMMQKSNVYDAILLDFNMPYMNGIEFLEELEGRDVKPKIIIVSTIAKKGAKETIRGLELGAFDFVKKPDRFSDVRGNTFEQRVLEVLEIATNINAISEPKELIKEEPIKEQQIQVPLEKSTRSRKILKEDITASGNKIVAIACSTGGPKALNSILTKLPGNIDASILIVQHMPEGFTKSLSDRLDELCAINVKEAEEGDILQKGFVYIAKGGHHMRVKKRGDLHYLTVTKEKSVRGLMPSADIMFESLIDSGYSDITCIVLTGMGSDGTLGIKKLSEVKNTYVVAQNKETSAVYGMPRVVYEAGLVDRVITLDEVADIITNNMGVY